MTMFPTTESKNVPSPIYRKAQPLPGQILDHCTICIEEQLFSQAFSLLSSALTSGTATGTGSNESNNNKNNHHVQIAAQIPPPTLLSLAATLTLHPHLTTRTTSPDKHAAADTALQFLRAVDRIVGARNAGFYHAFSFVGAHSLSSRGQRAKSRKAAETLIEQQPQQLSAIRSIYAGKESLWTNAEDFWAVVGWAFNCSVKFPSSRWIRWRLFLEFILDVLERDLTSTITSTTAAAMVLEESDEGDGQGNSPKTCLFSQYLSTVGQGRSNKRRVMRALLADGSPRALAEFPEIWRHETKPPKPKPEDRMPKRRKLDLENGDFGDYFDDESGQESGPGSSVRRSRSATATATAHSRSRSRAASRRKGSDDSDDNDLMNDDDDDESDSDNENSRANDSNTEMADPINGYGGVESIHLRRRFFALLTRFSAFDPKAFLNHEELFDLFTEFLRPLPLPVFEHFVLPMENSFSNPTTMEHQVILNQMLLRPILAATAPRYSPHPLTQEIFESHFAPYAANNSNTVDNAKVSLLVESLLRFLWKRIKTSSSSSSSGNLSPSSSSSSQLRPLLQLTPTLRNAVKKGIQARREKASGYKKKPHSSSSKLLGLVQEDDAREALECSAERMLAILDMID